MGDPDQHNQTEPPATAENTASGIPQWVQREDTRARDDEQEATGHRWDVVMGLIVPLIILIAGGLISLLRP